MKKYAIVVLAVLLAFTLSGCKSPSQVIAEKAGEKIIEKAGGGKVDIDGDEVTVKAEDGAKTTIGGSEWPKDKMAQKIPKLESGKVAFVTNGDTLCTLIVEEVKKKAFEDYRAQIAAASFTAEKEAYSDANNSVYVAKDGKGIALTLSYEHKDERLSVSAVTEKQ